MNIKRICVWLVLLFLPGCLLAQRTWDTIPNDQDYYRAQYEKFKKEPVVKGKVIFLGNSITEGGNWKKLLKDSTVVNRGISGDITFGILNRIDEVAKRQPSKLFLLIGINDIAKNIPDEIIMENIFSIVSKVRSVSPKTKIFIQSILPTNNSFPDFPDHKNKDDHVATINAQLEKYGDRLKYAYVDLYANFSDSENRLDAKYTTDGLHLNAIGYAHWVDILKNLK
jgi:lysophospholipase L1-like esterase